MASIFDPLINDPEDKTQSEGVDPGAERHQTGLGIVGQGMGLEATCASGRACSTARAESFGEAMQARERARQRKTQEQQLAAEAATASSNRLTGKLTREQQRQFGEQEEAPAREPAPVVGRRRSDHRHHEDVRRDHGRAAEGREGRHQAGHAARSCSTPL